MRPLSERHGLATALRGELAAVICVCATFGVPLCSGLGCGGSQSERGEAAMPSGPDVYGVSSVSESATPKSPVRLELTTPEGETLALQKLRGTTVLLFLFATYDLASQAALKPLMDFEKRHPELRVVGVALQPNPAKLLELYAEFGSVTFPLAFDQNEEILPGLSTLGQINSVPTYILVDERGHIAGRKTGPASEEELEELLSAAKP